jgi:mono/diheme cytochrome c family protein
MIGNILIWLALIAMAALLIWLAVRAWRARRWFIRFPAGILSSLLALLVLAVVGIGGKGLYKLYVPVGGAAKEIHVDATAEMVQRGEHLATVFCADCHSTTGELPLTGGLDLARDIPFPIGSAVSVNLTPAGPLKDWSDGEVLRVMREGVGPDGKPLLAMGSNNARFMSDDDLMALIAFLRSQPAAGSPTQLPADQLNFLGVLITGSGMVPDLPPVTSSISAPPKAASAEYGKYILSYQDCSTCHGPDLHGGTSPLVPKGPPLLMVRGMTQAQFINMMRTGQVPGGGMLKEPMPWKAIGRMDDVELSALYQYLVTIP